MVPKHWDWHNFFTSNSGEFGLWHTHTHHVLQSGYEVHCYQTVKLSAAVIVHEIRLFMSNHQVSRFCTLHDEL